MKITGIRCYVWEEAVPPRRFHWRKGLPGEGDGTPPGKKTNKAIVKVETDEGFVGTATGRGYMMAELVRRRLKHFIGKDPTLTEMLWREIWEVDRIEEFPMYDLGALDLACWDIKSQKAGMPLWRMLGGSDPRVPAYASTVTWDTMAEYERYIKMCRDDGFRAFKLHAWGDAKADAKLCRNLRKWVGDDADLMFDGSAGWDYVTSLKFGRVLEDLDFFYYEEPMREFDLPSYAELCRSLDIPVLGAETSDGCHWNAATWIQMRALDMVRTSTFYKGGITGALKIAHLAESHGMRVQVHGMGLANLHLCAAVPNNDYYEQLVIDTKQIKSLRTLGPLSVKDGYVSAPEEPGLGPYPDWKGIEKKAVRIE